MNPLLSVFVCLLLMTLSNSQLLLRSVEAADEKRDELVRHPRVIELSDFNLSASSTSKPIIKQLEEQQIQDIKSGLNESSANNETDKQQASRSASDKLKELGNLEALSAILELVKAKEHELRQEQQLAQQKAAAKNSDEVLHEDMKNGKLKTPEDLIRFIVSLVVPDVLKTLMPHQGARNGPIFADKQETNEIPREINLHKPEQEEFKIADKVATIQDSGESPEAVSFVQLPKEIKRPVNTRKPKNFKEFGSKLRKQSKQLRGIETESKRRQTSPKLKADPQSLELALKLIESLESKGAKRQVSEGNTKKLGNLHGTKDGIIKVRKQHRQESKKSESKSSSHQLVHDSMESSSNSNINLPSLGDDEMLTFNRRSLRRDNGPKGIDHRADLNQKEYRGTEAVE